jgi:Spy/CpxP family protein refolding chaperone
MKTMLKKSSWIFLTAVFMSMIPVIYAQTGSTNPTMEPGQKEQVAKPLGQEMPPNPPEHEKVGSTGENHPGSPDLPGLSDDQKEKIRKAELKQIAAMTPLRSQLREKKAHLATLLSTHPVDLKETDLVAEEIGKLETSMLKQKIRHDQEIRSLLTPEQQTLYDARPKPFLGKQGYRGKERERIRELLQY